MNNIENLKELLEKLSIEVRKDRENRLLKESKGEMYNVFNVLGLYSEEVRLHSRFLSNLLNPKGSHGLKDAFLIEFLKCLNIADFEIETKSCTVKIEHYIGPVTSNSGGRIDILINNGKKGIVIENKIYAADQENQLIRYENFARESLSDGYKIVYLTLYGDSASEKSTRKNEEENYIRISYKKNIRDWLCQCVIIAERQPAVKEVINQYLSQVKQLTNQNMETEAQKQVIEIATSNVDNLASALTISSSISEIKRKVVEDFAKKILEELNQTGYELTKVEIVGSDIINIRFEYKKHFIYFGYNEDSSTYVSIKDESSSKGGSKIKEKLEFNTRKPDKWNPYGYKICFDTNWNKDNSFYEKMLSFDQECVEKFKNWIQTLKGAIDKIQDNALTK